MATFLLTFFITTGTIINVVFQNTKNFEEFQNQRICTIKVRWYETEIIEP